MDSTRVCNTCHKELPIEDFKAEFYRNKYLKACNKCTIFRRSKEREKRRKGLVFLDGYKMETINRSGVCQQCNKTFLYSTKHQGDFIKKYCSDICMYASRSKKALDSFEGRFWSQVNKTPGLGPNGDCWEWTGRKEQDYGMTSYKGKNQRATRAIWRHINNTDIDKSMFVCHSCDNRTCVRPSHLFLGTPQDNVNDFIAKGLKSKGSQVSSAKLNEMKVREMRDLFKSTAISYADIAKRYNVCTMSAWKIINRKSWRHVE